MDYTRLSLADVRAQLEEIARYAQTTFGAFDARRLNWRADDTRWSVAQCLEHLLTGNALMFRSMEDAFNDAVPRTVWQRLPILPTFFGKALIRSQSPTAAGKYTAPTKAQPTTSAIADDVVQRFVMQHRDALALVQSVDDQRAARAIMGSPFIRAISYSVLDGWRIVVAHDWRHLQQARRVTELPEFPRAA